MVGGKWAIGHCPNVASRVSDWPSAEEITATLIEECAASRDLADAKALLATQGVDTRHLFP